MVPAIETSIASAGAGTRVVAYPRVVAGGDHSSDVVGAATTGEMARLLTITACRG
ncbi:MAG: hypothetical protein II078_10455 [Muribaculaceae bacterium]|nr:hypothetical protein [Muribaculaceae bacterium]